MAESRSWPTRLEWIFLALCAAILSKQLLLPGFIGLADNGDFVKVSAYLRLQAADHGKDNVVFFQPRYLRADSYYYNWNILSSERMIAFAASELEWLVADRTAFDIRWLGAIHSAVFLAAFYTILLLLRPFRLWPRALLSLAALLILTDVWLVSYFNSFYMDTAALLGGLAMVALAAHLLWRPGLHPLLLGSFGFAAILYCTAKPPHALGGLLPAAFLLVLAWRTRARLARAIATLMAVCIAAAAAWTLHATPEAYRIPTEFEVVFYRIANHTPSPAAELRELGLDETYLRWVGWVAFREGWPGTDPAWSRRFLECTSYARILRYYVAHPGRTASFLWLDLRSSAWVRRLKYDGNFPRSAGHPPLTLASDFGWWSALASRAARAYPAGIAVWHCFILLAGPILALRARTQWSRALAWSLSGASALACTEFLINCLADSCATDRHLCVFQLFTDTTVVLAIVLGASLVPFLCRRPAAGEPLLPSP